MFKNRSGDRVTTAEAAESQTNSTLIQPAHYHQNLVPLVTRNLDYSTILINPRPSRFKTYDAENQSSIGQSPSPNNLEPEFVQHPIYHLPMVVKNPDKMKVSGTLARI